MNLFVLPFKNALVSWWRSLTLGLFFMILCFLLVFFQSLTQGAVQSMESAVTDGLTGHIQLRPATSTEVDMADIQKSNWSSLPIFEQGFSESLVNKIKSALPDAEVVSRLRQNFVLVSDHDKVPTLTIGIDVNTKSYRNVFQLTSGKYLEKSNEILLTEKDAAQLKVKVGDSIAVIGKDKDGYTVDGSFVVVGIGNLRMLSMFRFTMAICLREGLAGVIGLDPSSASEVIVTLPDSSKIESSKAEIKKVVDISATKFTDYHSMGSFIMSVASATGILFYFLLVVLMLVMYLLIANLVFLSCLERYKEIGTFRALGFSKFQVAGIFIGEIFIVTGFFGIIGILLAIASIFYFGKIGLPAISQAWEFAMGKKIYLQFHIESLIPVVIIAALFIFLASFFPSLRAVKVKPVESLREE